MVACVEYTGTAPCSKPPPHGNSKTNTTSYRQTTQETMDKIKDVCNTAGPSTLYQELISEGVPVRDIQQIKNIKTGLSKQASDFSYHEKINNLADGMQAVDTLLHSHPKVQSTIGFKGKTTGVVLYTEEQLTDFKRSCCAGPLRQCTEVGVDKTFNLGPVHLTVTAYKQPSVTRKTTGDNPVFIGPMFLHGNSDFASLLPFFQHLRGQLIDVPSSPVFGSDDDKAQSKAIDEAFPNVKRLTCTRHLKENIQRHLCDTVGCSMADRQRIMQQIFGPKGMCYASDPVTLDIRQQNVLNVAEVVAPTFIPYFNQRIVPMIRMNLETKILTDLPMTNRPWTNNNCESMNHVLKQVTEWKSRCMLDLILILHNVVRSQQDDLKRALIGMGNYQLAKGYEKFELQPFVWDNKSPEQKKYTSTDS